MTNTFETTLVRILNQEPLFKSSDEKNTELGVVLPLLRQVGWDTEDISEVKPQSVLSDGRKVDFDFQIDGESRILIEVKSWGHDLNHDNEGQLAGYCRLARPSLAVLTSGRDWRLYLPPTRRKGAPLREFLEFDITTEQSTEVENYFRQFLARDKMSDAKSVNTTESTARKLHRERQSEQKFRKDITAAWNELANDKNALAKLVLGLAENRGLPENPEYAMRFLDSLDGSLVNKVPTAKKNNSLPKPHSFGLVSSPTGKKKMNHQLSTGEKSWNKLLLKICELMKQRHSESFSQNLLLITDWFAENKDSKFNPPVGDTGIYTTWAGGAKGFKDACYAIVTEFGYPRDSFVIRDAKGVRIP